MAQGALTYPEAVSGGTDPHVESRRSNQKELENRGGAGCGCRASREGFKNRGLGVKALRSMN